MNGPTAQQPATMHAAPFSDRELRIEIWPDEWADYIGAAAHLQAEGLIPEGFEWPRAADHERWEAGGFTYWLRRVRPEGHKGPMRSWLALDHWCLRVWVAGRDYAWYTGQQLARKAAALKAEFHRHTPQGRREWDALCKRYWAACSDRHFQSFKALVPGLVPPKRGRKPRATELPAGKASDTGEAPPVR
jgi:hypothetical protein